MHHKYGGVPTTLTPEDRHITGAFYLRSGKSTAFKPFAFVSRGGKSFDLQVPVNYQPIENLGKSEKHMADEMKMLFNLFQSLLTVHSQDTVTAYTLLVESVGAHARGGHGIYNSLVQIHENCLSF